MHLASKICIATFNLPVVRITLVNAGNKEAIGILGDSGKPQFKITAVEISPASVPKGGDIRLAFQVVSTSSDVQRLLIDYAVHFVKVSGKTSRKVFKLRTATLGKNESIRFEAVISTKEMTTRKHYPGRHHIEAIINGDVHPLGAFELML